MTHVAAPRLAALALLLTTVALQADEAPGIPHETFRLDNGLTVVVHEDRKAPIVAVNLWYHVGSKNERPGRTGFAHLFEHIMFEGSENHDDDFFLPLRQAGATEMNGTTSFDRTNYFQNVPTTALDLALFLESDRMGHLLGALDQRKLDQEREVVKNEKRQRQNEPYGEVFTHLVEGIFPEGHPYSWMPIGRMEDLEAAELDDVREWFERYYGPDNAVLVLAGDIDVDTAREKVERYFGHIPPGPPLTRVDRWIPTLESERRTRMDDRVPQARVYMAWPAPEWGSREGTELSLTSSLLTSGRNSRLQRRLVHEEQIATDVGSFYMDGEIAGMFVVWASAQSGGDLAQVEAVLREELERFVADGPEARELERVQTQRRASFVRGIERVGGFGGKSDILAENTVYAGRADFYRTARRLEDEATPEAVRDTARAWLTDARYVLEVHPYPRDRRATGTGIDRSELPFPDSFPEVGFPEFERATLDNGLELIVAHRSTVPVVQFSLLVDAGYATDGVGSPGLASLAMSMLSEGTATRSSLEISDEAQRLGANLSSGANLDRAVVGLSALNENLDASLDLYADLVLNPSFPADELERLRRQVLSGIQREKASPQSLALRVLPRLLYGEGHAYATPFTGSGTEQSVAAISRDDLAAFHRQWFRPNNATLIIVGDTTLDDIRPRIERLFADWEPAEVPDKPLVDVARRGGGVIHLLDRPGAEQSVIIAGHLVPPQHTPDELALQAAVGAFGGDLTARLDSNLRSDKGWSYGVRSQIVGAEGQRPMLVLAPVQSDRTADAIQEIRRELRDLTGEQPITEEELERQRRSSTLTLPGRWETASSVLSSISQIVRFNLDDDHWDRYADAVRALTLEQTRQAAGEHLDADDMVWVVVGDARRVEEELRALDFDEVRRLDDDGNPL